MLKKLRDHVAQFATYYTGLIIVNRDPNVIAADFEGVPWDGSDFLIDHAEPFPLEIFGDYVAYRYTDDVAVYVSLSCQTQSDRAPKGW